MFRDYRNLLRKHLRGNPVPGAKLKEVVAAECIRFERAGCVLDYEIVLKVLGEIRPDCPRRTIGHCSSIVREDLRPLLTYAEGGLIAQATLEELTAAECVRLLDEKHYQVPEMVLRILDGLRPRGM